MKDRESFTDQIKAELVNVHPARPCCQHAELHAMVQALVARIEGPVSRLRVPRNAVARKIVFLTKTTGGTVQEVTKGATEKRPTYRLRVTLPGSRASDGPCCARATLRGAFLARGVIGNPANAYHLEITLPAGADGPVVTAATRAGIPLKRGTRRGQSIVYLKGAEPISRLLGLLGANRAVMRLENDRIFRDMRSQANRRVNSETANLDKRLRAALVQVAAIRRLKASEGGLATLPAALRNVAELRLAHPQAGLLELAAAANLSKSAVANRLRRLMERADGHGLIASR
ncbi:MAG TPA: DNA-binding protein WhiA [Candidatus Dormibacteraeota bacterium]|jgi:DNA-binding protein WhiA